MNAIASLRSGNMDMDDFLSPILVKELRQGMGGRIFPISFLLLQVLLVLLTMSNVAAQEDRTNLELQNGLFWTLLCLVLLVLTPMRGLGTISTEVKNRTLETISLTRLTAWRVVFGKWSALFAQSLLLVTTVLPYVVLRYFLGGQDVVSEFVTLFLLLLLSGLLIAGSIAISAVGNPIIRIIVIVALAIVTLTFVEDIVWGGSTLGFWEIVAWLALAVIFLPALLFEITASGIAPAAENHAIRRRLLAVIFFLGAVVVAMVNHSDFPPGPIVAGIALIAICYFDLTEKPRLVPRMARTFSRRGFLGKFAGYFLLPGWPSALLFSLVVIPATIVTLHALQNAHGTHHWMLPLLITATLGSILIPVFVCHLIWRGNKQVLLFTVFYNLAIGGVAGICEGFHTLLRQPIEMALVVIPGLPVLSMTLNVDDFDLEAGWTLLGNAFVLTIIVLLLLLDSRKYFSALRATFSARSPRTATDPAP